MSRNIINKIFNKLRKWIVSESFRQLSFSGEIELDESYFGASRVGRGAAGKTSVFGVFKCDGNVFVKIEKNCKKESL